MPHLYVDRRWIESPRITAADDVPPSSLQIDHQPAGGWQRGLHEARVVYRDEEGTMRWYAWSFLVE